LIGLGGSRFLGEHSGSNHQRRLEHDTKGRAQGNGIVREKSGSGHSGNRRQGKQQCEDSYRVSCPGRTAGTLPFGSNAAHRSLPAIFSLGIFDQLTTAIASLEQKRSRAPATCEPGGASHSQMTRSTWTTAGWASRAASHLYRQWAEERKRPIRPAPYRP